MEYSGVDPAQPVDAVAAAAGNSAAPSSGNLTTRYAGDAIVGYTAQGDHDITSYNFGSGFTPRVSNPYGFEVEAYATEDQISVSPGTYAASFGYNPNTTMAHWVCIAVALKPGVPAVVVGAGASVHLRNSLVNRPLLA